MRFGVLLLVPLCLGLANAAVSIRVSLGETEWQFSYFDPDNPWAVAEWIVVATAIGLTTLLTTALRHRWRMGALSSLAIGVTVGIWLVPVLASAWRAAIKRQYPEYTPTFLDYYRWALGNIFLTREWVVAYVAVAIVAAAIGIAFGRYFIKTEGAAPSRPRSAGMPFLSRLAAWGRQLIERLRPGPGSYSLAPAFTAIRRRGQA